MAYHSDFEESFHFFCLIAACLIVGIACGWKLRGESNDVASREGKLISATYTETVQREDGLYIRVTVDGEKGEWQPAP